MIANHEPILGSRVCTLGGRDVGIVGAVRAESFFVRDKGYGFWLRKEAVYLAEGAITTLQCETTGMEFYRMV